MANSSTTTTLWRCDRCGAEESTTLNGMPSDWRLLGFAAQFDKHRAITGGAPRPHEICTACVGAFTAWLESSSH